MFPKFEEYLKTFTDEKKRKILGLDEENPIPIEGDLLTKDGQITLFAQLSSLNLSYTINLLEDYHSWLSEQLEKHLS